MFIFLILSMACSHTQKIGDLIDQEAFEGELYNLEEINLSDQKKFNNFLNAVKRELLSVKKSKEIPFSTWNKIGRILEIYKNLTQSVSQNKILIPGKTKLVLKVDSFCIDPGLPAPDTKEVFQWGYGDPEIPYYSKIMKYYVDKGTKVKELIQELIWNLANHTYYEEYPENLKRILREIDSNAYLKLPSRTKSEIIDTGVSVFEDVTGTHIRDTIQIVKGKYYSIEEFKKALENLQSSHELPQEQFFSKIPNTSLFSTTRSQSYRQQTIDFYNPGDESQTLDLGAYYLKSFRPDVQRIAVTASLGNIDYLINALDRFFRDTLSRLGVRYPKLTSEEKELIKKYPYESLSVFWYKARAEVAERMLFGREGGIDDEADAFRHFVWAGFLIHGLGENMARRFLSARESEHSPDAKDRQMDEYNNKKGIEAALKLINEKRFTDKRLYELALDALKNEKLIVLRPRGKIPDDESYF